MPREQEIVCGCKANIYLRIIGRRKDGLHDLRSLFLPLDRPFDRLFIIPKSTLGIDFKCSVPDLSRDNIVLQAFELFAGSTGFGPGVSVYLEKNIPHGAGLGGGSSNAAAVLRFLNDLAGDRALPLQRLRQMSMRLGADVPFFLDNTPAWVSGAGERIQPVYVQDPRALGVLIYPDIRISTAWAYKAWDEAGLPQTRTLTNLERVYKKSLFIRDLILYNSFEGVVFQEYPELAGIKCSAFRHGASACILSGSGSAMLAFFRGRRARDRFRDRLQKRGVLSYELECSHWGVAKR
ncbi:MAG: 4-(cytidine 5'-diphospho)-2-C-methyl-D-erythritol kinase [Desulfonatronovibrionaceae bacterium]